jgi:hypothetical protein
VDFTNAKDFGEIWADAFPKRNTDPMSHMRIWRLVELIKERSVLFAQSHDEFAAKLHDVLAVLKISEIEFAEVEREIAAIKTSTRPQGNELFAGQRQDIPKKDQMPHGPSLRVIGQSLEVAKVPIFELDRQDDDYVVSSNSLTQTGEWILRHALSPHKVVDESQPSSVNRSVRFSASAISRLDDQAKKQRRNDFSTSQQMSGRLPHLLRALGDHLDQFQAGAFHISWIPASVSLDFQSLDGRSDSRTFTTEKLQQLGVYLRFRRSRTSRYDRRH